MFLVNLLTTRKALSFNRQGSLKEIKEGRKKGNEGRRWEGRRKGRREKERKERIERKKQT